MNFPSSPKLQPCELFSSRDTLEEALEYANSLIEAMPAEHRSAAYTAMWVPLNTQLKISESLDLANIQFLPGEKLPKVTSVAETDHKTAAIIVRSTLPKALINMEALHKVMPKFADNHAILLLMVSRMFNLSIDELLEEALYMLGKYED